MLSSEGMSETDATAKSLTFEQLVDLRAKTEAVAQLLQTQLRAHLETLRPLFSPRRVFGKYVGGKEEIAGAEKAFAQLRTQFQAVCGRPFSLPPELEQDVLSDIDGRLELFPWEYTHDATHQNETRTLTITSPLRWVLTFSSGYTLSQLRQTLAGQQERRSDYVRQFVLSALVMRLLLEKFPGIGQVLTDLRYQVGTDACPGLGDLPLVTISACLSSFRPADDLILTATRFSGVPAFIELVDIATVPTLQDPLKLRLEQMLSSR
jgi:hypothetical protein